MNNDQGTEVTIHDQTEARRSKVRRGVTYAAAFFLFVFGPAAVVWMLFIEEFDLATGIFNSILPVATGVIAYWFGARGTGKRKP